MTPDLAALDLEGFLAASLAALQRGVEAPRDPLHTVFLATIGTDGAPRARSVVPRAFEPPARRVAIHTDRRSEKVAELRRDPRATLLAYDPEARLQLRLEGRCAIHAGDAAARRAWDQASPAARRLYRIAPAPGTPAAEAEIDPEHLPEEEAFANFALILLTYDTLDALFLGRERHRRMRTDWKSGTFRPGWIVP